MKVFHADRWYAAEDFLRLPLRGAAAAVAALLRQWESGRHEFALQTSGSTGPPQSLSFSRAFVESRARTTARALNLRPARSALLCLPISRAGGFMVAMRAFILPMDLIVVEPIANPLAIPNLPPIHFAAFTPYQVRRIMEQTPARLAAIPTVIIGGAPIPPDLETQLGRMPNTIYHTYGMTETLSHIALRKITDGQRHFRPLPDVRLRTTPRGTLQIHFPEWDRQIETRDVVTLHPDGIAWLGRIDNVINSGGIKIHPEVLEQKIAALPAVRQWKASRELEFYIVGVPDPLFGETVSLVYTARGPIPPDRWDRVLRPALAPYERPRRFFFKSSLSYTTTGKIIRSLP